MVLKACVEFGEVNITVKSYWQIVSPCMLNFEDSLMERVDIVKPNFFF